MEIVLDVYGGDYAPAEIVKGAVKALDQKDDLTLVLFGKQEQIIEILKSYTYDEKRVKIFDSPEIVTNDDIPTDAIRKKTNSSLVAGLRYLGENENAKAFVSAGSTGAVLTGAVLLLKRIRGINRPALCPVLPTVTDRSVLLMDCGANVECKPVNLVQFAQMASAYAKCLNGNDCAPKIGLLSNGTEEKKGNTLNKETYPLLKNMPNFIGNIEGRDILSGVCDIVVCDGYAGNIALKSCEGTALSMFSMIKDGIMKGGLRAKIGYLLLKPVFKSIKKKMDYNKNGGAVLLGLEKIVIKSHGSSKAETIKNSILQAYELDKENILEKIKHELCAE